MATVGCSKRSRRGSPDGTGRTDIDVASLAALLHERARSRRWPHQPWWDWYAAYNIPKPDELVRREMLVSSSSPRPPTPESPGSVSRAAQAITRRRLAGVAGATLALGLAPAGTHAYAASE